MSHEPHPEAEQPDEALLWTAWAETLDGAEAELDEEILGLLDGTSRGATAARARRRLAEDPRLARSFGELVELARSVDTVPRVPAPGRRIAEARELVPPTKRRAGAFAFLRELFSTPAPAALAAAAAVLLVTLVLRAPEPERRPELRGDGAGAVPLEVLAPSPDATVQGDVRFAWRRVPEASAYRVVLMDVAGGSVGDLGPTASTELVVPAAELTGRFGAGPRTLHWVVRARLADGTETASAPARMHWSAPPE